MSIDVRPRLYSPAHLVLLTAKCLRPLPLHSIMDFFFRMGSDSSKLKHTTSVRDGVPSIRLPSSATYHDGMCKASSSEISRSRKSSASSRGSQSKHPLTVTMRRLIQGCFTNPHETIGRRIMKRACDLKPEFAAFYSGLEPDMREEIEDEIKTLLKKVVANIDYVEEIQRLAMDYGQKYADLRPLGFRADFFAVVADATIKECTHLDSAVHKAHTTTHAFSQFGALIFSAIREGFYEEIRRLRRASNSFSTGSNGSQRKAKKSLEGDRSRGSSPRVSLSRGGSPRSASPDSQDSGEGTPAFLKPPTAATLIPTRSY